MVQEPSVTPDAVKAYLDSRPRWIRWREWLVGRRYALAAFPDRLEAAGGGGVFPSRFGESPGDGARRRAGLG